MKIIIKLLVGVSVSSALLLMTGIALLGAGDYMNMQDYVYEEPQVVPDKYDPDIFAYDANRGELRKEYFGIKLTDLKQDENGHYVMSDQQCQTFIKNILGKHMCSLQWISWKDFGTVNISQGADKTVYVKGGQKSRTNSDYLEINGTLTVINPLHLQFKGEIITCVDHINNGKPVKRKGTYNFTVSGQRRYWRMQEMNNPEDRCCDYVDIYFD